MHRATQELAIKSISVYSSRAHAFVAVVPEVMHMDTGDACDGKTYQVRQTPRAVATPIVTCLTPGAPSPIRKLLWQMRLWTRAECLTHLMMNGTDSMWIISHAQPRHCIKSAP